MSDKKTVIIPTYNEKENIEAIIRKVFSLDGNFEILIVDDGSPDGTANIVKQLQGEFGNRLNLIERKGKLGLGTAYLAGFEWCLNNGTDYIFEMDADFSHNPDDLIRLYNECANGADVAVGSRYLTGMNVVDWAFGRLLISYSASKYVRIVTRMKIKDSTAGFICYRQGVLKSINFNKVRMKGYGFQIEMKYTAHKLGFKIKEIPIVFVDRKLGTSKMSSSIFGEAMWGVLRLRFRNLKKQHKKN